MCTNEFNQDSPIQIRNMDDKAILITVNIENHPIVPHKIDRRTIIILDVLRCIPNRLRCIGELCLNLGDDVLRQAAYRDG